MCGALSAKSRLRGVAEDRVGEHAAAGETSRSSCSKPADVAHAAQQRRPRRRAGQVQHHGLFEAVSSNVQCVAAPLSAAVTSSRRPEPLPGDEQRVRRVERIDRSRRPSSPSPTGRCGQVEPLRARHIPGAAEERVQSRRRWWSGRSRRATRIDRRDHQRSRVGGVGRNSAEAEAAARGAHVGPGAARGRRSARPAPAVTPFGPEPLL